MKNDLEQIKLFLNRTPVSFRNVIETTDFLTISNKINVFNAEINNKSVSELFLEATENAFKYTQTVVNEINEILQNEKQINVFNDLLEQVGLKGNTLALKGIVFSNLWDGLEMLLNKGVNTFDNQNLRAKFINAIEYLSCFLNSLIKVFPNLEILKEFIELMKGILNIN